MQADVATAAFNQDQSLIGRDLQLASLGQPQSSTALYLCAWLSLANELGGLIRKVALKGREPRRAIRAINIPFSHFLRRSTPRPAAGCSIVGEADVARIETLHTSHTDRRLIAEDLAVGERLGRASAGYARTTLLPPSPQVSAGHMRSGKPAATSRPPRPRPAYASITNNGE